MSVRDWMYYGAVGGFLAVFLGIGVALGQGLNQGDVKSKQAPTPAEQEQESPSAPSVPPAVPTETGGGSVYRPNCDSPQGRDEADLCEQRRMADAAYETVEWAETQFYATVGEIVALIATIAVAIFAVIAAFRANRISRESAERQLRAYLVIDKISITRFQEGEQIEVHVIVKNTGQTPAYSVKGITAIMAIV